jgi:hypothetical protein
MPFWIVYVSAAGLRAAIRPGDELAQVIVKSLSV